ncbi:MAG: sensor histidine kinase [Lachnospirales bacterium]
MVTKLKNISNNMVVKTIVFIIFVGCIAFLIENLVGIEYSFVGNSNFKSYCEENELSYGEDLIEMRDYLYTNINTLDKYIQIKEDKGEHSVHELLNLDMDYYLDEGLRYIILDTNKDEVIGTDGITEMNVDWNYWSESISFYDKYRTYSYTNNDEIYVNAGNSDPNEAEYFDMGIFVKLDDKIENEIYNDYAKYEDEARESVRSLTVNSVGSFLIGLIILFYFVVVANVEDEYGKIRYKFIDRIHIDILILLTVTAIILGAALVVMALEYRYIPTNATDYKNYTYLYVIVAVILCSVATYTATSIGRSLKRGEFLDRCFIVIVCRYIYNKLTDLLSIKSHIAMKIILALSILMFIYSIWHYNILDELSGLVIGFTSILVFLVSIAILKLVGCIEKVGNNKLFEYKRKLWDFPFIKSYEKIEEISQNNAKIYNEGIKAQSLKTELVTNVSHDLRTPLTSIIGYVDLLDKKSENFDDESKEYIEVLKDKSNRMKGMVEDLFMLSKSASGNVELELSKVNVKKLIEQSIDELDVASKGKEFVLAIDEDVFINVDGNKIYRVIQNVVENALKYSLEGTRIHIVAAEDNNIATIEVKNIANYEMKFTSGEIVERFTRGDVSRSTEGSGLGLSIAKTFTNLNGGVFNVIVDGDMFKVVIKFDKA